MYRILDVISEKDNYQSLYRFQTTEIDGIIQPKEFETDEELDAYVEDLLNNKGYAKSDFLIVSVKEYGVKADIVEDTAIEG